MVPRFIKYTPKRKQVPPLLQNFPFGNRIEESALFRYPVLEKRDEIDTRKKWHIPAANQRRHGLRVWEDSKCYCACKGQKPNSISSAASQDARPPAEMF